MIKGEVLTEGVGVLVAEVEIGKEEVEVGTGAEVGGEEAGVGGEVGAEGEVIVEIEGIVGIVEAAQGEEGHLDTARNPEIDQGLEIKIRAKKKNRIQ